LPPLLLVFSAVFQLLFMVAEFYFWLLLISVVMSWISPGYSPFSALINQLCEPLLAPLRRILPAMGGLDLSPIVAFLAIRVVEILLDAVSKQVFALVF
jgi:YggT family protein